METETFTAERRKSIEDANELLNGVIASALNAEDFTPIIAEAVAIWRAVFGEEGSEAEGMFEDVLTNSLNQTTFTEPGSKERANQVTRMSLWLASFAVNDATASRLDAEGTGKEWVTMQDDHVRETHRAVDGNVVPQGGVFIVGGTPMRYPGEPVGNPDLWMGCRCVLRAAEVITAAAGEDDDAEEVTEEQMESDMEEVEFTPVPWHGVLAPVGVLSGDGRMFAADAEVSTRDLPIPLKYMKKDKMGHEDSVVVANITNAWVQDGLILGEGVFADTEEAAEAIAMRAQDMMRGISVDLDMTEAEFRDESGKTVDIFDLGPDDPEPIMVVTKLRIAAATICAIPSFQEAYYDLGTWADESEMQECEDCPDEEVEESIAASGERFHMETAQKFRDYSPEERERLAEEGKALPDGSFPIVDEEDLRNAIQAIGRASDPEKAKAHIKKRAKALDKEDLVPEDWSSARAHFAGIDAYRAALERGLSDTEARGDYEHAFATFAPGTKDGPGWITDPVPTARIRRYWVRGQGAAKIRWGVPGDFNRCRRQLAKYIANPSWLAGTCANMHKEALGFWPGDHHSLEREKMTSPAFTMVEALTASAGSLKKEWFDNPNLNGPTPLTITDDGHIYGHVATWGTCHIGRTGKCLDVPSSASNYAYFHVGAVETDEGLVPVGHITMETGHADLSLSATATLAHYDNTAMVAADVRAGEDSYGVWVSGVLRPHVKGQARHDLLAAALSGDWRAIGGSLEMVAALAVNVPGFPIPRIAVAASGAMETALVAAGMVVDEEQEVTQEDVIKTFVREAITEYRAQEKALEALPEIRAAFKAPLAAVEDIEAVKKFFEEEKVDV